MRNWAFKICFSLMVIILFIASYNYVVINHKIYLEYENTSNVVSRVDSLCTINSDNLHKNEIYTKIKAEINRIPKKLHELNDLKMGLFDSNTITFLSSFVLIFLAGILFDIEKRAKDKLAKTKKAMEGFDVEMKQLHLYKYVNTIHIISKTLQLELSSSGYVVNEKVNVIAFEMSNMLQELLDILWDKDMKVITKNSLDENKKRLRGVKLIIEKEDIWQKPENKESLVIMTNCKKLVNKCLKAINDMKLYEEKI